MRGSTMIWLGVKHVGRPKGNVEPLNLSVADAARRMVQVLASQELAKSINIYVGRSYEDVRALMSRGEKSALEELEVFNDKEFDDMFNFSTDEAE